VSIPREYKKMAILINDVPIDCINHAAIAYHVPATLILSIMKAENGKNGEAIKNKNGTVDYGVMGINSIWLPKVMAYGYTKEDLQFNACKNVAVGTWIISQNMANNEPLWKSIANYHSRTPSHNKFYQASIYTNYKKVMHIISNPPDKSFL